jgi:methionine sulfoxide reductase heme-binding subunit
MSQEELWFINRGSGVVLLAMCALSIVLGVVSVERVGSRWWPRFLSQGLHRNVSLLSTLLMLIHAVSAVVDEFVDIRWWHVIVPFTGTYQPFWLALGTLALDLTVAIVLTSLLRTRVVPWLWRTVHLTTYLVFGLGVVHGIGIGTDAEEPWSLAVTLGCLIAVMLATAVRLAGARRVPAPLSATGKTSPE